MLVKSTTLIIASLSLLGTASLAQTHSVPRPAYCSFNEQTLTWHIGNELIERTIIFDKATGALRTQVLKSGSGMPTFTSVGSSEGEITVRNSANQRTKLTLDHDWTYAWQTVATPAHMGRALTIHLTGVKSNSGYEVEANYEILPNKKPFFIRSLTLINRNEKTVTIEECLYDRWSFSTNSVPEKKVKDRFQARPRSARYIDGPAGVGTLVDDGLSVGGTFAVEGGFGEILMENSSVVTRWKGRLDAKASNGRAFLPETVVFTFRGVSALGVDLIGRYRSGIAKK